MKESDFFKANDLMKKIREVELELTKLHNGELLIDEKKESFETTMYDVKISKQQLKAIIKYNREILTNRKIELQKILKSI